MNKSIFAGIGLAILGVSLGLYLEGGRVTQLLQPTAAIIVFGGTLGAILVQFPFATVLDAGRRLLQVFRGEEDAAPRLIEELRGYASKALRKGLISLDADLENIADPFLRKALTLAVDGATVPDLRQRMEREMEIEAERENSAPRVFEAAGGFAPTIGILGAVIGLIQVMQRLDNISEVGKGIAVAFVATIYGVGIANLFLLPCAGRIRNLLHRQQTIRQMILEGVVAILEKTNPRVVEMKLTAYRASMKSPEQGKLAS